MKADFEDDNQNSKEIELTKSNCEMLPKILFEELDSPQHEKKQGNLFQMYKEGKIDNILSQEPTYKLAINKSENNESQKDIDIGFKSNQGVSTNTKSLPQSTANLIISRRQQGNSVIDHIKNVRWMYGEIEPDFVMSRTSCALYLSLRYHTSKPNYIHSRIRDLKSLFELRVLLVFVDMDNSASVIRELCNLCINNDVTMLLAWSDEEVARYLESYKTFENKPPDILTGDKPKSVNSTEEAKEDEICKMVQFLASITSVNKTDARTLIENFGSIEAIMKADFEQLKLCSGIGALKARTIYDLFRKPVLRNSKIEGQDDEEDL